MRLILLTTLTMIAFAANSVLNRLALVDGVMGPAGFATIRLIAGAVTLSALKWASQRQSRPPTRPGLKGALGAGSLALYMLGFSFAYVSLPAGVGALILFGGVQVTMFTGAVFLRETVPPQRMWGGALAFGGLVWLLWPSGGAGGGAAPPLVGSLLMAAAALGWGIYSLLGRGVADALASSTLNFVLAIPLGVLVYTILPDQITFYGAFLAVLSGGVTSGMGYALWYRILPQLGATRAAVAQLSVPLFAMAGGMVFLAEDVTMRFVVASLLVMAGVWVSMRSAKAR